jgi:hypothetical protein
MYRIVAIHHPVGSLVVRLEVDRAFRTLSYLHVFDELLPVLECGAVVPINTNEGAVVTLNSPLAAW